MGCILNAGGRALREEGLGITGSQHGFGETERNSSTVCARISAGYKRSCGWLNQLLAGRYSRAEHSCIGEGRRALFSTSGDKGKETPRLDLQARRWSDLLKGKEHCRFVHTDKLFYCFSSSTSTETHSNNVNRGWENDLVRASFHLIGFPSFR